MLGINWRPLGAIGEAVLANLSRLFFYWPFSWRGISALILGVLLAKWFWILFAPHAIFTAAMPVRAAGLEAGQLFGVTVSTEASTQGVALPNAQLLGVFAPSAGKRGFAVLKLDDARQVGVAEGEDVTPGNRLVAVHADHVLVEHGGMKQRINLDNISPGSTNQGIQAANVPGREKRNKHPKENVIPEHILSQIQSAQQQDQPDIKNSSAPQRVMRMESSDAAGNK